MIIFSLAWPNNEHHGISLLILPLSNNLGEGKIHYGSIPLWHAPRNKKRERVSQGASWLPLAMLLHVYVTLKKLQNGEGGQQGEMEGAVKNIHP